MLTGNQLKMLRIRLDLLQTDIAITYDCTKQYISNIENGIEKFYSEEKYKAYVNAIYKAQALKQQNKLPKYDKDYDKIYRAEKKELEAKAKTKKTTNKKK